MKKKPMRLHFLGQNSRTHYEWAVGGNDPRMHLGINQPWYAPQRGVVEASRWTPWSSSWHPVSELFRNARSKGIPIDHKSGKKNKKFWRKVYRRIARLAP